MSLALSRPLADQARSLVTFLAGHQHSITPDAAARVCAQLPADPKAAAKELKLRLAPLGVELKHTHALKAVAVARAAEGYLGLGAQTRWDLASWSPDAPGASAKRQQFATLAEAADEFCRRVREQYEDDSPYAVLTVDDQAVSLRACSYLTAHWWHVVLVPTLYDDSPTTVPLGEVERLTERLRRLIEGEYHGWLDRALAGVHESRLEGDAPPAALMEAELVGTLFPDGAAELPDAVPAGIAANVSPAAWGKLRRRYAFFAARHEDGLWDWARGLTEEAEAPRFERQQLNAAVVERARSAMHLSYDAIAVELRLSTEARQALQAGAIELRHVPVLARLLHLDSANDILPVDPPGPRLPLPLHGDIALFLSRLDAVVLARPEHAKVPTTLVARLQAMCAVPLQQRRSWAEQPPAALETLNQEVRFAGLVVGVSMGTHFARDLPLGLERPSITAFLGLYRELDILTQAGKLPLEPGFTEALRRERDPVTPEWLARFNAQKFTTRDIIRYTDKTQEMRDPDANWRDRFTDHAIAAIRVFGHNPEKCHAVQVRMEALAALLEWHSLEPWVRTAPDGKAPLMLSQAAMAATAQCELVDVAQRPGFDFRTFYLLCVKHARD